MLGISPKNPDVLLKYLGGLHHHLREASDVVQAQNSGQACVQAQYLENIGLEKSAIKWIEAEGEKDASKEGKKKKKGEKIKRWQPQHTSAKIPATTTTLMAIQKRSVGSYRVNPKNKKKDNKKKNLMATDSSNQVERSSDVDEKIVCTSVQKEVNLSSLQQQEEKEMTKLFHIKIQVKKTKIDALFDSGSQENLIATELVKKLGLEVHDHPNPYPLGWC